MTTLVLSNHVPAIEQALIAAGQPVVVAMTKKHARLRSPSGRFGYPVVTVSDWDAFGELHRIAQDLRGTVTHVATRWEGAIPAAGFVRDLLDLPGQSFSESIGYVDKAVMKQRLRHGGVPVARHRVVHTARDVIAAAYDVGGWPVVVKPLRGFASINTHVIGSAKELADFATDGTFDSAVPSSAFYEDDPAFLPLAKQRAFLVEEFVDIEQEFHCDGLWIDGRPIYQIPGVYHAPPLVGMGGMLGSVLLPRGDADGQFVVDLAIRAAKALGIGTGFTHAEVYRSKSGRWLLGEIAARPGGGGIQPAIKHAFGVDVMRLQGQVARGADVHIEPEHREGVVGWAGPAVPPGRIVEIAALDKIRGGRGVIDATVAVKVGQLGGRTGSGLWGGLAGYVFLRGESVAEVMAMMTDATDRYEIRVERPVPVGMP